MAYIEISGLEETLNLDSDSVFPVVFQAQTKKVTFNTLAEALNYFTSISYNATTGVFTFTRVDGTSATLSSGLQNSISNASLSTGKITFTKQDGSTFYIDCEGQRFITAEEIAKIVELEEKYDAQIRELANENPQLPEIVDARGGFDTLGEKLENQDKIIEKSEIKVHFVYSGSNKGDCIVIETTDKNMIIDFGYDSTGGAVINYMRNNNISHIDYALVTHYHIDHIGGNSAQGLINIINSEYIDFSNCLFLLPPKLDLTKWQGSYGTSINYDADAIMTALTAKGIEYREPAESDLINLDFNSQISFFNTYNEDNWNDYYNNTFHTNGGTTDGNTELNNFSIVAQLIHGKNTFLFTGDIEPLAQGKIKDKILNNYSVYKLEHHGANDTTDETYLHKINPKIAVCMNTEASNYDNRTLQYLRGKGITIYTTNESHNIVITSDKVEIKAIADNDPYYQPIKMEDFCNGQGISGVLRLFKGNDNLISSGDDLNDYETPGTYVSNSTAVTQSLSNRPSEGVAAGFTLDVRQLSTPEIILQILYTTNTWETVAAGTIFCRVKKFVVIDGVLSTEWQNWIKLNCGGADRYLASGEDLNDLSEPGIYMSRNSTISASLQNCPITTTGFKLTVEYVNALDILRQTIVTHNSTSDTFFRTLFYNGSTYTWQAWYKVNTTQV